MRAETATGAGHSIGLRQPTARAPCPISNQQPQNNQPSLSQYCYLCCIDLEATCDDPVPGDPLRRLVVTPDEMETIELGLVMIA